MGVSLAACGSNKPIATTNGGKITQSEYYSKVNKSSAGKQILQQMILNKVLNKEYGNKVTSADINTKYNQYKAQYGGSESTLNMALQQSGMTKESLKSEIKSQLLIQAAVKDNLDYTTNDLKNQFKSYQPKVTVGEILVTNKQDANKVINKLKSGAKFSDLAKQYSKDVSNKNDGGKLAPFDNTNTDMDQSFVKAAYTLSNSKYTEKPVKTKAGYQVIKMINHPKKGKYEDHINDLKDQIANNVVNTASSNPESSAKIKKIISKVLKRGGVEIEDKNFQNVLSGYLTNSTK
ncbi:foldase protein PrsA [Philodulcilactobacillus myokoensis]|uniref:Foldase protein PrsA n=1 Tax=Philodulcilactobacillus myokoensis TaxID=2929573 RepID=A0A9W6B0A3_9LACO|nr:peptidylprolyl isomerase [Philodulcilactobacillus myokoensis]GLB46231.1 foldase protein PrsA [Philodulcilactobacillus myokoensis]